jgi:cephalosporin hydroxylase
VPEVVRRVKSFVEPGEAVMMILDSDHSKQHVLAELEAYHDLITSNSYIIVADGIMKDLYDVPRGKSDWTWNNPVTAAAEFVQKHAEFVLEEPIWPFNESDLHTTVTYCFGGWLRRR